MALPNECEALTRAFSGIGVDEKSIISTLGKWKEEESKSFRKGFPQLFREDHRLFERVDDFHIIFLEREFSRFKKAVILRTMHPWERDARMAKEALTKGAHSYDILIEIACTRSSEELLGARKAYHSLFDHSIEEDVAYHIQDNNRNLLVALVSSYRYEGPRVHDDIAKTEAKNLCNAIKNAHAKKPIENEEIIRILTTRSKPHLNAIFKHYKEICGETIDKALEDDSTLKETVQCLGSPQTYFSKVLDMALKSGADDKTKEALTRVIVTRAETDMKQIKEEYHKQYGVHLSRKLDEATHGNYKDFLLALVGRGD